LNLRCPHFIVEAHPVVQRAPFRWKRYLLEHILENLLETFTAENLALSKFPEVKALNVLTFLGSFEQPENLILES
jgi:hypothetical protein